MGTEGSPRPVFEPVLVLSEGGFPRGGARPRAQNETGVFPFWLSSVIWSAMCFLGLFVSVSQVDGNRFLVVDVHGGNSAKSARDLVKFWGLLRPRRENDRGIVREGSCDAVKHL